ncbi:MAG: NAD(P)-dependent oxidoreductase [Rhodospirillaceae bacterium]|jgi:3-hydroxyisobutyrate dehydrogenase-like beta-hydroxyacid dehydrogenase|nr:NAD(P)-dependent oxidoreductase [Rhodospirillaceae bacterium]MBT6430613.1 NAD(P)-dependent oxidoreductase [Rhodospirillaceae bacterium]
MAFSTIAILSPGNMGGAVGACLKKSGYDVLTCLAGRSDFTRRKAEEAGFRDVPDMVALVREADLILSILDPAKADEIAEAVAAAMKETGEESIFADCNATSPATAERLNAIIEGAGGRFVDVGIIGGAPTRRENYPQFCTSGPHASLLDELHDRGVRIERIGPDIGQGSAIKICNGAYNKGAFALYTSVMLAAEHYGCTEFLRERLPGSQAGTAEKLDGAILRLPSLSGRYIGEMEQVAETFAAIGLTPQIHQGAADLFRLLNASPLASERREEIDPDRTVADVLQDLAKILPVRP